MSNKAFYSFVVIGVLVLVGFVIAVTPWNSAEHPMWHSADDVKVNIDGSTTDLQSVIDDGSIGGGVSACSDCDSRYYIKSETYTKEQINAMISTIESGGSGTGCPVGYTYYEQSTETAKCYKDGEEIVTEFPLNYGDYYRCMGRVLNGVLQSRAMYLWSGASPTNYDDSGWLNGASTATVRDSDRYYTVFCSVSWSGGVTGYWLYRDYTYSRVDLTPVSFDNVLQIQ